MKGSRIGLFMLVLSMACISSVLLFEYWFKNQTKYAFVEYKTNIRENYESRHQ